MESLPEILQGMATHTEANPTHGWNCACKDKFLRQGRLLIRELTEGQQAEFLNLAHAMTDEVHRENVSRMASAYTSEENEA